jgi:hypothetical protein
VIQLMRNMIERQEEFVGVKSVKIITVEPAQHKTTERARTTPKEWTKDRSA